MRTWSIVGALALVLAFSTSAVTPAFAQTPVATTTVAGSPDDQSKDGAKATEEQPKPEKPKGEEQVADAPAAPAADAAKPKPEAPKATEPKPTGDEAKPEKPKAAAPKPTKPEPTKPAEPKPTAEKPKPAEPKPTAEKPKPAEPKPTAEKPTGTGAQPKPDEPKATADEPVAPLHVAAAQSTAPVAPVALPTRQAAHGVDGSPARPVGSTRAERTTAPPDRGGMAGAARSDPAPIGTAGDPGSATQATGRFADAAMTHAARLAPDDAARAAAPSDRRPIRALPLDSGPSSYDLTLLLTIVFTAGVAFLIGRETRRLPRAGARR